MSHLTIKIFATIQKIKSLFDVHLNYICLNLLCFFRGHISTVEESVYKVPPTSSDPCQSGDHSGQCIDFASGSGFGINSKRRKLWCCRYPFSICDSNFNFFADFLKISIIINLFMLKDKHYLKNTLYFHPDYIKKPDQYFKWKPFFLNLRLIDWTWTWKFFILIATFFTKSFLKGYSVRIFFRQKIFP